MTAPQLARLYERRFAGREAYRQAVWCVLCQEFFSRWISPDATVLDLGAGNCEFINAVTARRRLALDLNPQTALKAATGIEVWLRNCAEPWLVEAGSVDVIFTSNFFEHLPAKPDLSATLAQAHRALRAGGTLLAIGPNVRYTGGAYWDFWDHHIPLTDRSLSEALEQAGFRVTKSVPRFLPYTMSGGATYPFLFLKAYLRLPLLWRLFGQQFFIVAVKPAQ